MKWLTVKEFAKEFQYHPITVYRMIAHNEIPHLKIGGAIRIPGDAFERIMEANNGVGANVGMPVVLDGTCGD